MGKRARIGEGAMKREGGGLSPVKQVKGVWGGGQAKTWGFTCSVCRGALGGSVVEETRRFPWINS